MNPTASADGRTPISRPHSDSYAENIDGAAESLASGEKIAGGGTTISSTSRFAPESVTRKNASASTESCVEESVHRAGSSGVAKKIAGSAPVISSPFSSHPKAAVKKETSIASTKPSVQCPVSSVAVAPSPLLPAADKKTTSAASSQSSVQNNILRRDFFCRRGAAAAMEDPAKMRAEIIELFNSETYDEDKVRAWRAREKEREDAHMSGDLALMYKVVKWKLSKDKDNNNEEDDDDVDSEEEDYDDEDFVKALEAYESDSDSEEDEDPLCPIICDFLCDLPRPSNQLWGREITGKVLAAWGKCHQFESRCTSDYHFERVVRYAKDELPLREDTVNIDVRGLYSEDAHKTLRKHLFRLSHQPPPFPKYLNVIVGCTLHGIGEGKLRQTVIDELKVYKTLKWSEGSKGAIISINLEDSLGWTAFDFAEDYVADEKTDLREEVESKEKLELCTVICDFLWDLPTDQRQDPGMIEKVQAALQSCYRGECGVVEDTVAIDLRGLYSGDVENMLVEHLHVLSCQSTIKYLDVTVGCIEHGLGKGNLWGTVTNILLRDETIEWVGYDSGAVISIELDGRKDYSKLRNLVGR